MLYVHYFDLNNISKHAKFEKSKLIQSEVFKQCTFKPKINKESKKLDKQHTQRIKSKINNERDTSQILVEAKPKH